MTRKRYRPERSEVQNEIEVPDETSEQATVVSAIPILSPLGNILANIRERFGVTTRTCPRCKAEGFGVFRTAPTEDGQKRQRRCESCGFVEDSIAIEIPLED